MGRFSDMGKKYKVKSWAPISRHVEGLCTHVTVGKPLKGPLSLLPHEGKLMPSVDRKEHLLSPVLHGRLLRRQGWHYWAQPHGWELVQLSVVHSQLP